MTQYTPRAFTDDEVGEGFWTLWNGLIPAYLSGQAGTNVPAGVGKGFVYTKLDSDGNILGAYFADGLGGESPVSPAHILWGVTDAAEARSALGIGEPLGVVAYGYVSHSGALSASSGVSSVSRIAEGRYQITFSAALPDANFVVVATLNDDAGSYFNRAPIVHGRSASGFYLRTTSGTNDYRDNPFSFIVVRAA